MSKTSLMQVIIHNLQSALSTTTAFSQHHDAELIQSNHSLQYYSGCEFPFFNGVFSNNPDNQKDDFTQISNYFQEKNRPFVWWWTKQTPIPTEIQNDLDKAGFYFMGEFAGIAVKLDELQFQPQSPACKIKRVENEEDYASFLSVFCEVFQLSDSIKRDFQDLYGSYGENGKFKHYLGYENNKPVATVTAFVHDDVLGLYNGATLESAQKMGFCTALIQQAVREISSTRIEYAVAQLMAPGMAKGLTEKMGFKKYGELLPFLKEPA